MRDRFLLQPSREEEWWICTDREHNIVCKFKEGAFNETQKFTLLDGDEFETREEALAYANYLRELGDWLKQNHSRII